MDGCKFKVRRKPWELPFLAEPEQVGGLRNIVRLHLGLWGLQHLVASAQLCMTELVTNVITHVGCGTPTTLAVSMNGQFLRLEVTDPDPRALPTLLAATDHGESGRGIAVVDAVASRWGVILRADSKVTWCELATGLRSADDHVGGASVDTAEALLSLCCTNPDREASHPPGVAVAEEVAIKMMASLLYWLRAHGCAPYEALERAQGHFEAGVRGA
ncbi:ATP-binding protein [Streptomyces sp. NPDC059070]|uniref:ATP-binding protein n=1 Tax=Streptomyces sp. NPDC059070 TaxID=3346713 RepID=UPI003693D39A